jgi:cell wall-associated NlpC family hydrolase
VDCVGLVIGVARDLGLADVQIADYPRTPQASRLMTECRQHMRPLALASVQPGDVLLMRFRREPQHVAVAADYVHGGLSIVHAYEGAGAVVEHRLDDAWLARVVASFSIPGIVDE